MLDSLYVLEKAGPVFLVSGLDRGIRRPEPGGLRPSRADLSLRELGVGIHVDDFGTGYSSISVLWDLPVTGVKLDLRFVHDLTAGDSQANALARGLSGLFNALRLTGIAEGVETPMQADILRAQGWECAQGYYFGRPAAMPVSNHTTGDKVIA